MPVGVVFSSGHDSNELRQIPTSIESTFIPKNLRALCFRKNCHFVPGMKIGRQRSLWMCRKA